MTPDEKEFFERLRRCKTVREAMLLQEAWARKMIAKQAAEDDLSNRLLYGEGVDAVPWTSQYMNVARDLTIEDLERYIDSASGAPLYSTGPPEDDVGKSIDALIESTRTKP